MALFGNIKSKNAAFLGRTQDQVKAIKYFSSGGTTINIENQSFADLVHEFEHETPDFIPISGVFLCLFAGAGRVPSK